MGEVKKKGNMAVLTLVRKNMDQNQNEEAKKEVNVLGNVRRKGIDCTIGLDNTYSR